MALQSPARSGAQELRKGIALRLAVALLVLAGLALGWHFLQPQEVGPQTALPAAEIAKPEPAGTVGTESPAPTAAADPQSDKAKDATKGGEPAAPTIDLPPLDALHSEGIIRTLAGHKPVQESADIVPPVIAAEPAVKPKIPHGPYLQVGVFMHPANAAELKAKLEAQGIPVFIATRVQVGPFKDKREAEAMREKLKAMGMTSILINQ